MEAKPNTNTSRVATAQTSTGSRSTRAANHHHTLSGRGRSSERASRSAAAIATRATAGIVPAGDHSVERVAHERHEDGVVAQLLESLLQRGVAVGDLIETDEDARPSLSHETRGRH